MLEAGNFAAFHTILSFLLCIELLTVLLCSLRKHVDQGFPVYCYIFLYILYTAKRLKNTFWTPNLNLITNSWLQTGIRFSPGSSSVWEMVTVMIRFPYCFQCRDRYMSMIIPREEGKIPLVRIFFIVCLKPMRAQNDSCCSTNVSFHVECSDRRKMLNHIVSCVICFIYLEQF